MSVLNMSRWEFLTISIILFTISVKQSQPGTLREERILKDLFRQLLLEKKQSSVKDLSILFLKID